MASVRSGDPAPPDLAAVFHATPDRYLILAPDLSIVAVNDAYLSATMTVRREVLGRSIFDVFPDDPKDATATGVATLRASLSRVLTHKRPDTMAVQRYAIRRPLSQGGTFEERHWSPSNTPVLGADGRVQYIIHRVEDVSELVRLKRESLEHAETIHAVSARSERFSLLLDTAPDAIVIVGEDARIQLINSQTEALFGYSRHELIGQPLDILIPERFRKAHLGHMSRYFADPTARPMGSAMELCGRRRDASEIPIEVSLSPQRGRDGITVSAAIRDVSERKRLEDAARLTADRLKSAVDSIQDAFALFDAEDRLVLCNSVFRRLVHEASSGALVGKRYVDVLDAWIGDIEFADEGARDRFRHERLASRVHEQTTIVDVRLRDGRSLRVIDRRTPEGGIVKTIWDRTDDERVAAELREAKATAEAASKAKSAFLSSMSHELRTPLNAILGFAQLMDNDKRAPLPERNKERVAHILSGGEHLLRLIDEVLDLARIEAGKVSISPEPVEVERVLDEVLLTLEPMAGGCQVVIEKATFPNDVPMVHADRTRFAQILMNLGSNGIKYNRPGGKVRFAVAQSSPSTLRVTVTDTGMGIPLDKQDKLFQPFQRAGQEAGPIEGTGIGLVITKQLAQLMGGGVGFQSEAGNGSVFWVDIPVHIESDQNDAAIGASREAIEHSRSVVAADTKRHLVLYVEDNPANVTFMRDLMSTLDVVDLLTVPSAELGVDLAHARHPEVIIMDINLPGMSGLDALRALRAAPDTKDIPIIGLTAAASQRDKERGVQAGFYRYLTKPLKVSEFISVITELLSHAGDDGVA